ncbi:MAG: hypothetical protein ACLFUS_02770 [Candidatus Sumerlaeia bacterium]
MLLKGFSQFELLLDKQIEVSKRYCQFTSLALISAGDKIDSVTKVVENSVRTSDIMFDLGDSLGILMPCTDSEGAKRALERYRESCKGFASIQYGMGSFPEEQKSANDLMNIALDRLYQNKDKDNALDLLEEKK